MSTYTCVFVSMYAIEFRITHCKITREIEEISINFLQKILYHILVVYSLV